MKSVTFEATGKERALRFDINAMARYQDRAGETISALIQAITKDGFDILRARRAFWASLTDRMTEDEAGEVMAAVGTGRALELVGVALRHAIQDINGETDGADSAKNPPEPRSEQAAI